MNILKEKDEKMSSTGWEAMGADYSVMAVPLTIADAEEQAEIIAGMNGYNIRILVENKMSEDQMEEWNKARQRYPLINFDYRDISIPRTTLIIVNFGDNKDLAALAQQDIEKVDLEIKALEDSQTDYEELQNIKDKRERLANIQQIVSEGHEGQPEKYFVDNFAANEPALKEEVINKDNHIKEAMGVQFYTAFVMGR
jgi:hypothetical protein